jgi:hypothetical protein
MPPPIVARAIADDRQQPRRQPVRVDAIAMAIELEEGLGGQIFRDGPIAHAAEREPEDGRQMRPVEIVEPIHRSTFESRRSEDAPESRLR